MHEVGHLPQRTARIRQQRVPAVAARQAANPRHRELRTGRGSDRGGDAVTVHVGKYRSHTLSDQCLRNGAADAVSRTGDQGSFVRGVEWIAEEVISAASDRGLNGYAPSTRVRNQ